MKDNEDDISWSNFIICILLFVLFISATVYAVIKIAGGL